MVKSTPTAVGSQLLRRKGMIKLYVPAPILIKLITSALLRNAQARYYLVNASYVVICKTKLDFM